MPSTVLANQFPGLRRAIAALCLSFYFLWPQIAEAQAAGTLVSAQPIITTPPGQQAWRIEYVTTDAKGVPLTVTGMVVAPREAAPREPRRVIAWAHGTWGVASRCAPSLSANFFTATPALSEMVAKGYVVIAPDYPGLGSTMPHPYLVGEDTARSVLDAVRAARSIAGAASGTRFAVWGESQGGHAALWTGALARGYAPELTLVGTAAAAPPTDLIANFSKGTDPERPRDAYGLRYLQLVAPLFGSALHRVRSREQRYRDSSRAEQLHRTRQGSSSWHHSGCCRSEALAADKGHHANTTMDRVHAGEQRGFNLGLGPLVSRPIHCRSLCVGRGHEGVRQARLPRSAAGPIFPNARRRSWQQCPRQCHRDAGMDRRQVRRGPRAERLRKHLKGR